MGDHIFISYSHADQAIVEQIVAILQRSNIRVWRDHENIPVGTPDWEQSIRQGITTARGVIYAASEDAAKSQFVRHELLIARDNNIPIYPLWIAGTKWSDSVPFGYANFQYADGRSDLDSGIKAVIVQVDATHSSAHVASKVVFVYSGWDDDISWEPTGRKFEGWCSDFQSVLHKAGHTVHFSSSMNGTWANRSDSYGYLIPPDIVLLAFTKLTGESMVYQITHSALRRRIYDVGSFAAVRAARAGTPILILATPELRVDIEHLNLPYPLELIPGSNGAEDGQYFLRYLQQIV